MRSGAPSLETLHTKTCKLTQTHLLHAYERELVLVSSCVPHRMVKTGSCHEWVTATWEHCGGLSTASVWWMIDYTKFWSWKMNPRMHLCTHTWLIWLRTQSQKASYTSEKLAILSFLWWSPKDLCLASKCGTRASFCFSLVKDCGDSVSSLGGIALVLSCWYFSKRECID